MNRRQIALKLVLDRLDLAPTMRSFDERLALQKTIYLAQNMGVPLAYHFSWYLRGPYSRDLTADAFANIGMETPEGWDMGETVRQKVDGVKPLLAEAKKKPNPVRELEKLASVLFVIKTGQASDHESEKIAARMRAAGKDFGQGEVNDAVNTLRKHGLLAQVQDRR